MVYNFHVDKYRKLTCTDSKKTIVSNINEVDFAQFTFDEAWDDYSIVVTFKNSESNVKSEPIILNQSYKCYIPKEPLQDGGTLIPCVYGTYGDSNFETRMIDELVIIKSDDGGELVSEATQNFYNQLLEIIATKGDNLSYVGNTLSLKSGETVLSSVIITGGGGREVELRNDGTYIQWRYVGDATWINLVALADITGDNGKSLEFNWNGTSLGIRQEGQTDYVYENLKGDDGFTPTISMQAIQDGVQITVTNQSGSEVSTIYNGTDGLDGLDGKEVELQVGGGYIQWRYVGDTTWSNLIALSALVGATGRGISYISKTGSTGLVDTYTITYSDGTQSNFNVTNGEDGNGVPTGGTTGQILVKKTNTDYDTEWIDSVQSVNGQVGEVVLKTSDLENDSNYVTTTQLSEASVIPKVSLNAIQLINDVNDGEGQVAFMGRGGKLHIYDRVTMLDYRVLDSRELITNGAVEIALTFQSAIYNQTEIMNIGADVFLTYGSSVSYEANRVVKLFFKISNTISARTYKLRVQNTTEHKDFDFATSTFETIGSNNYLTFTFLDSTPYPYTSGVQTFTIYKDGEDSSGVPTLNKINELLSAKETLSNKQNNMGVDGTGTKYPTVDAVNYALSQVPSGGSISAGYVYLSNNVSTVNSSYKALSYTPDTTATTITATANNNTVSVGQWLYPDVLDTTSIPSGVWSLFANRMVSNSNNTSNTISTIFLYHSNGTTTDLFSVTGSEINDTVLTDKYDELSSSAITVGATDRLGVRVQFATTRTASTVFTLTLGDGKGARFSTPLPARHNTLRALNGDSNYQHVTSTWKDSVDTNIASLLPQGILDSTSTGSIIKELVANVPIKISSTTITTLQLKFPTTVNWYDMFTIIFKASALILPSGATWHDGVSPTIDSSKWYELSIRDNRAVLSGGSVI